MATCNIIYFFVYSTLSPRFAWEKIIVAFCIVLALFILGEVFVYKWTANDKRGEDNICLIQGVLILIVVLITLIVVFSIWGIYRYNLNPIMALTAFIVFALMTGGVKVIWENKKHSENNPKKEVCAEKGLRNLDAWEAYKQADNLYHQRFNFFLVAESMLVVSFATTFSSGCLNINPIRLVITLLGMVFTFSGFYVNNGINYRMIYLREKYLRRCNQTYKNYLESVEGLTIPSSFFMTYLLPLATFVFWCYLFYFIPL
jgi:hypothetical protein